MPSSIFAGTKHAAAARFSLPDLLLTVPFLALFLVQLAHHRMWRDELNAFGIALASPTLPSLFRHLHYEGHPWLWYVLLWVVSRWTASPLGMKMLEAGIGAAIYLVLGLVSPFSRVEKTVLFLCYFISFEYTVLSRMYGVLLLLVLLYARQRALRPERVLPSALLLGLMASTDMMGLILSGALAAEFIFSAWTGRDGTPRPGKRQLAWGALLYLGLAAFSIWSLTPMPDISWRTTGHPFALPMTLKRLFSAMVSYIVLPYFPTLRPTGFWNPLAQYHRIFFSICLPLVLGAYYLLFRRHRNLLLLLGITIAGSVAFGYLIYLGAMRHYGITFLAFLVAVWLLRSQRSRLPALAYMLLGLTAAGGISAGIQAWRRPFSNAEPAANWLKANHLDTAPLIGTPDTTVSSIAELLHRPVYMLDCNCSDTFLLFSRRRDSFTLSQIPDRLALAMQSLGASQAVYLGDAPFSSQQESEIARRGIFVRPLATFAGAEAYQEDFYVYQVNDSVRRAGAFTSGSARQAGK